MHTTNTTCTDSYATSHSVRLCDYANAASQHFSVLHLNLLMTDLCHHLPGAGRQLHQSRIHLDAQQHPLSSEVLHQGHAIRTDLE